MCKYSEKDLKLHHCMYKTFLHDPRLHYGDAAKACGVVRNTFTKHWKKGLENGVFYNPQIRPKMFNTIREYIYLVQTDDVHELFEYYKGHPNVIFLVHTIGRFDLLIQTNEPLKIIPNNTIFYGGRSNYRYPLTLNCTYEDAFDRIDDVLDNSHTPSKIEVTFPEEPDLKGAKWGWKIFPYLKYNLRPNYTWVVKNVGISFTSFYAGYEYLLNACSVLLPHYPLGYLQYSHRYLVFWSDYEELLCEILGLLPCHVAITKIGDALFAYINIRDKGTTKKRYFDFCHKITEMNLINKLWEATPIFHWVPDTP